MKRILTPTSGPATWRTLLRDPEEHWKRGRSALECAVSWELAQHKAAGRGIPLEVAMVLDRDSDLEGASLIFGVPEHGVALDKEKAPSKSDVWALLRNARGLISLAVEAKAGEPFGQTVTQWLNKNEKREGRQARLAWICGRLGTLASEEACGLLRYQLLHRLASAVLEAERCGAVAAVMVIQAFPGAENSLHDFERFGSYLGVDLEPDRLARVPLATACKVHLAWIRSPLATDREIAELLAPV